MSEGCLEERPSVAGPMRAGGGCEERPGVAEAMRTGGGWGEPLGAPHVK